MRLTSHSPTWIETKGWVVVTAGLVSPGVVVPFPSSPILSRRLYPRTVQQSVKFVASTVGFL